MNDNAQHHIEIVNLLAEISGWKGLAKELHEMLCYAVEWNWLDDDIVEIDRYFEIIERVEEEWDE